MSKPVLQHLTPEEAHAMIQKDPRVLFIDVRSTAEWLFVGQPAGAIHIPWMDEPDWTISPDFVRKVREAALGGVICGDNDGCAPVVLICRSGNRSVDAGRALIDGGFRKVYNVLEGFEGDLDENRHRNTVCGWRVAGLPWIQC